MTDQDILQLFRTLFIDLDDFNYFLQRKPLLAHYTSIQVLEKIVKQEELVTAHPP